MHEATLAANILRIAGQAMAGRAGRAAVVRVSVGTLAGVMPDALRFAFDAGKSDTPLAGARLELVPETARVRCGVCAEEYEPKEFPYICPGCGSRVFAVVRGEDVYVKEMEIEA